MKAAALLLLVLLTAVRLWLAAAAPVTPLEAYYWLCAHRLDWAFFDGPAGTAWLAHTATAMLGDGPLGLRLAFPLLAAAASLGAFLLGRALFGVIAGIWAAAILNVLPVFNAAAVHAGPELPALALTLFAAWAFVRAMDHGFLWWLLGGCIVGLAGQFEYAAIFAVLGAALACVVSHRHRAEWRRPGIYAALAIPLFALCPAWEWNRAHDWPALATGTLRTAITPRWDEFLSVLGMDIFLLSVFAFAGLILAKIAVLFSSRIHAKPRIALCLAAPFALLWLYNLLQGAPGIFAMLCAVALFSGAAAHAVIERPGLRIAGAALLILTAADGAFGSFSSRQDPWSRSMRGMAWTEVASSLDALLAKTTQPGGAQPFLIAQNADATSALNYHLSRTTHPEVFLRESQDVSSQFALWPRYDDFIETDKPADDFFRQEGSTTNPYMGRDALYLTEEEPADLPQTITAAFARITPFATLELPGGRKMRVYFCENYQTMPL